MTTREYWVNHSTGLKRPGYMTHAELERELKTASGERREELVSEAKARMKADRSYPRFPASLIIVKDE